MKAFTQEQVEAAKQELRSVFGDRINDISHVGSTYISGSGNDLDIVVWVEPEYGKVGWGAADDCELLRNAGYHSTGHDSGEADDFMTFRKGDVNVMLTHDREFIVGFAQAAEVCKYVNAMLFREHGHGLEKVHRIMNAESA